MRCPESTPDTSAVGASRPAALRERRRGVLRTLAGARGAMATEYAVLVGVCGIVVAGVLAALGPPVVASYDASRRTVMAPVP